MRAVISQKLGYRSRADAQRHRYTFTNADTIDSDSIRKGIEWLPHNALRRACNAAIVRVSVFCLAMNLLFFCRR